MPVAENAKLDKKEIRDDAMVTARVPREIKRQGDSVLKGIGSNPTELVNAAYAYVIDCGELPPFAKQKATGRKELTPIQKRKLIDRSRKMHVKPGGDILNGRSFKEVISEMRYAEYEALS